MKIMIVDDHADMRRMLRSMVVLSLPGQVEISEYDCGEDAVKAYLSDQPDCVLMDLQMGGMNGFEAIQSIYEQDAGAKVIIVSSFLSPSFRLRAEALQVQAFVSKDNLSEITPLLQGYL